LLVFLTGVPGSGKSYFAVYHIYNTFLKDNKDCPYLFLYTNINQFKFQIDERFIQLRDFNKQILEPVTLLYQKFKEGYDDNQLNDLAKQYKLHKVLLVIDEAHTFFDKDNQALTWFLTYHRHFYIDIFLITQNLMLIHYKYRKIAEFFYRAVPRSLALNRGFRYFVYIDENFNERVEIKNLPFNKEVFSLYHSGDEVRSKSFLLKILLIVLLGFLFFLLLFFVFRYFFFVKPVQGQKHHSTSVKIDKKSFSSPILKNINKKPYDLIPVLCFRSYCKYKTKYFLKSYINLYAKKIVYENGFSYVYVSSNILVIENKKETKNEDVFNSLFSNK
jgi:zona occludens toxin